MDYEDNVRAILKCNFSQVKDELIDNAVRNILAIKKQDRSVQDFADRSYIKIPDNATNGDVILKVFPDAKGMKSSDSKFITYTLSGFVFTSVDIGWWKAPYKKVQNLNPTEDKIEYADEDKKYSESTRALEKLQAIKDVISAEATWITDEDGNDYHVVHLEDIEGVINNA